MVEVNHVVLYELHPLQEVADHVGGGGNPDVQRVLHCPHRRQRVHHRAHAADALREGPRVSRIATLQDDLEASELGAGRMGVDNALIVLLHLDPQVPLDTGNRVDDNSATHDSPPRPPAFLGTRRWRRSVRTFSVSGGRR